MKNNYRGDSPAKKFARLAFWKRVQKELGDFMFYNGTHIVLASAEAGDVSVLLGLGVPPDGIKGIDKDALAIEAASKKFPTVGFGVANIEDVLEATVNPTSVHLDFCTSLNMKVINAVRLASESMNYGVIGVGFMVGREHQLRAEVLRERLHVQDILDRDPDCMASAIARAIVIQKHVDHLNLIWVGRYTSETEESQGAPMALALFNVGGVMPETIEAEAFRQTNKDIPNALFGKKPLRNGRFLLNLPNRTHAAYMANYSRGNYPELVLPKGHKLLSIGR